MDKASYLFLGGVVGAGKAKSDIHFAGSGADFSPDTSGGYGYLLLQASGQFEGKTDIFAHRQIRHTAYHNTVFADIAAAGKPLM